MSFNEALANLIQQWTQLETSFGAIARLKNFSSTTPCEDLEREVCSVPDDWPSAGSIEFSNVTAGYSATSDPVIREFSLSIKAGEKVGICGRSGSGKSSLITSLFRMLEITGDSRIAIDDVDLTTVRRQTIRAALNAIPQEPYVMKTSVRENTDPEHQYTDEAIMNALQRVQLWEQVNANGGLNSELDLEAFSHGQRQLFCLARSILKRSKVVVLDEATSSVDTKTDEVMQKLIRSEFWDCTIIAVAHRLDTILDFDKIAVLDGGRLVEYDSPRALLSRASRFRALYDSR